MDDLPHTRIAVEPVLETDDALQQLADREKAALLAFVAPHSGVRLSPVTEAYATIGVQEEFGIESFIERCARARIRKLHFLVNSPGGGVVSSYKIAKALRGQFNEIRVYVPYMAASGGTLLALTGNEIVMGIMSHLSPLDPQVYHKGMVLSANTFLRCFERFMQAFGQLQPEEAPYPMRFMTEKLDPLIMEEMNGTSATCVRYVREILESVGYSSEDAYEKAEYLVVGFSDHSTVLGRELLAKKKFNVVDHSKYPEEWRTMRLWFKKYIETAESIHHMRYCLPKDAKKGAAPRGNGKQGQAKNGQKETSSSARTPKA